MTSEVVDLLKNLDLSEPKKLPPGKSGKPTKIATNSYRLTIEKGHTIFKYDVRIYETYVNKQGVASLKELCKQTKDDFTEQDRKAKTVFLLKMLTEKKLLPFGKLEEVVYDRAAILFSLKKYPAVNKLFDAATLKDMNYKCSEECTGVQFELKPVAEDYALKSDDAFRDGDGKILEFLNLLTSQHAFVSTDKFIVYQSNKAFLVDSTKAGFLATDCPALPEYKHLGIGCGKSVQIAESHFSATASVGPIVTIDVAKTAFHRKGVDLHVKVAAILNCPVDKLESIYSPDKLIRIKDQLKGLTVQPSYLKSQRVIKIKGIGPSADKHFLDIDGKKLTLAQYFQKKHHIQLKCASYTVIDENKSIYPIECLIVAPNQRVSGSQQSPDQMKIQVKACATPPFIRQRQTDLLMKSMELSPTFMNKHLVANRAKIESGPLMVGARVLPMPVVSNHSDQSVAKKAKSSDGFSKPALLMDWAVVLLNGAKNTKKKPPTNPIGQVEKLVKRLMEIGQQNGMHIAPPTEYRSVDRYKLSDAFEEAKKKAVKFILFVQSESLELHGEIKALEQKYQVLTQDLLFKRVTETGRRDTMKNIIRKMNMKLGGLNHYVLDTGRIIEQRNLIIGIEFTHPPPTAPGQPTASPSVLGFSSNSSGNLHGFVGDFKFIQARAGDDRSAIDGPLKQLFKECLNRFRDSYGAMPETIWVYRNGASEGQFPVLLSKEIRLFYEVEELTGGSYLPKMVYIAVSKDHVHRFYLEGGSAKVQNVLPGTVIDTGIVSPSRNEFFLSPHKAFQGTAKAPKYTVLRNGSDINKPSYTMDQIQGFTYALTFLHGIVDTAISLPAPLRVASECAKRGSSNYTQERIKPVHGNVDLEDIEVLNKEMVYSGRQLSNQRYNA